MYMSQKKTGLMWPIGHIKPWSQKDILMDKNLLNHEVADQLLKGRLGSLFQVFLRNLSTVYVICSIRVLVVKTPLRGNTVF